MVSRKALNNNQRSENVPETVDERRSIAMRGNTNANKTGLYAGRSLLKTWGSLNLDGRLPIVKERNAWLERVIGDKGGHENLSELQLTNCERLADLRLLLSRATRAVMTALPSTSLINKRRKAFHPILLELFKMSESFGRQCHLAGIKREPRPVPSPAEYLNSDAFEQDRVSSNDDKETEDDDTE